jgi:multiple antibiotic resistance protein
MIALEMVFERRTERRERTSEEFAHEHDAKIKDEDIDDPSVFPIGIPFIAGPGAIATTIMLMTQNSGQYDLQGIIIGAMMSAIIATMIILFAAGKIIDLIGPTIATAITRILGVLLAAMATQYIFDGIKNALLG